MKTLFFLKPSNRIALSSGLFLLLSLLLFSQSLFANADKADPTQEVFELLLERPSFSRKALSDEIKTKIDGLLGQGDATEAFIIDLIRKGSRDVKKQSSFLTAFKYVSSKAGSVCKEVLQREVLNSGFSPKETVFILLTMFDFGTSIPLNQQQKFYSEFIEGYHNTFEFGVFIQHLIKTHQHKLMEFSPEFKHTLRRALLAEVPKWENGKFLDQSGGKMRIILPQTYFFEIGFLNEPDYVNFFVVLANSKEFSFRKKSHLKYALEHKTHLSPESLETLQGELDKIEQEEQRAKEIQDAFIRITSISHEKGDIFLLDPKQNALEKPKVKSWKLEGSDFYRLLHQQLFIESEEALLDAVIDPNQDSLLRVYDTESTVRILKENSPPQLINYLLYVDLDGEKFIFSTISQSSWLYLAIEKRISTGSYKLQIYRQVEGKWKYFGDHLKYVQEAFAGNESEESSWKLNIVQELLKQCRVAKDVHEFCKTKKLKTKTSYPSREKALSMLKEIGLENP